MKCENCNTLIPEGDQHLHQGKLLCEDCYMVALSPIKTCDPWAVHSAKNMADNETVLTQVQKNILNILRETGGIELEQLTQRLAVAPDDLQREIATLRHMEKLKAVKEGDKKRFCLW